MVELIFLSLNIFFFQFLDFFFSFFFSFLVSLYSCSSLVGFCCEMMAVFSNSRKATTGLDPSSCTYIYQYFGVSQNDHEEFRNEMFGFGNIDCYDDGCNCTGRVSVFSWDGEVDDCLGRID